MTRKRLLKVAKEAIALEAMATRGPWRGSVDLGIDDRTLFSRDWGTRHDAALVLHARKHYADLARAVVEALEGEQ